MNTEISLYDTSKIEGVDYFEMVLAFNLGKEDEDDSVTNKKLKSFLSENQENKDVVGIVRLFVKKLSENDKYTHKQPLWVGLINVTDDRTFMLFVKDLLEYLWY